MMEAPADAAVVARVDQFHKKLDTYVPTKDAPAPILFTERIAPIETRIHQAEQLSGVLAEHQRNLAEVAQDPSLSQHKDVIGQAYDVVKTKERMRVLGENNSPASSEKLDKLVGERTDATTKQAQDLYKFFQSHYPGIHRLLNNYMPPLPEEPGDMSSPAGVEYQRIKDVHDSMHALVGTNLAYFIVTRNTLGKEFTVPEMHHEQINQVARMLLVQSPQFKDLTRTEAENRPNTLSPQSDTIVEDAKRLAQSLQVQENIYLLDPSLAGEDTQEWIKNTAHEARRGKKIYDTPHYRRLLKEYRFSGTKKNGIGGVILFGPPGTGKTELAQENNRQQGFTTRVVNIHHYTSFSDLIGEKAIQLGLDHGASFAQKVDAVLHVVDEDPTQFGKAMTEAYTRLQKEGKIDPEESMGHWLTSHVAQDEALETILRKDSLSDEDWKPIREGFLTRQKARSMRTLLGDAAQESNEDSFVSGEILLAIKNGERVVLDELDKAGPNSLGGILTLLAKSPGSTFTIGETTVTLPQWFRVDATSNSYELNAALRDRFSGLSVNIPPLLDQLMIAGVRVSSSEGKMLLTSREQSQMVGFFSYILPEINNTLADAKMPRLANRAIMQFTSYLVDFGTQARTALSFEEAVTKFTNEVTLRSIPEGKRDEVLKTLQAIQQKYAGAIGQAEQPGISLLEIANADVQPGTQGRNQQIKERFEEAQKARSEKNLLQRSPLIRAIQGVEEQASGGTLELFRTSLSEQQARAIAIRIGNDATAKSAGQTRNVFPLGNGMILSGQKGNTYRIASFPSADTASTTFIQGTMKDNEHIVGASNDGTRLIKVVTIAGDKKSVQIVASGSDSEVFKKDVASGSVEAELSSDGAYVGIAAEQTVGKERQTKLNVYATGDGKQILERTGVDSSQFSQNGRLLLVTLQGKTELYDMSSMQPLVSTFEGTQWKFAGNHLLVNADLQDATTVQKQAIYIQ